MGITCKPIGKMRSIMQKLENEQMKEKQEMKENKRRKDKENKK